MKKNINQGRRSANNIDTIMCLRQFPFKVYIAGFLALLGFCWFLWAAVPLLYAEETDLSAATTVKSGNYFISWTPYWNHRPEQRLVFDMSLAVSGSVMLLCAAGLYASFRGIGAVIAEGTAIKAETIAIITGDFMPLEKKERIAKIKKRGIGLRFKIAFFTMVLSLLIVLLISTPLYYIMTQTQRETLLQGLWDRSTVLLEGLATSVQAYLPSKNTEALSHLPAQAAAIPEARYITITGSGPAAAAEDTVVFRDQVWASNDPNIFSKIDSEELEPGVSRITDVLSQRLEEIGQEMNEQINTETWDITLRIERLKMEEDSIAAFSDLASRNRLNDIRVSIRSQETRFSQVLLRIGRGIKSEPPFSTTEIPRIGNNTYIFYKPVVYRPERGSNFFQGLIRLEVSTNTIVEEIISGQIWLLRIIVLIALAALVIGIIGSLVLSGLIIRPLRKLVRHVEIIRDTDDKSKLAGFDIAIATHDEIAVLGHTINDMTKNLVKASVAASDLSIGKEIQKKFIPLEIDREGNKLSTGFKDTPNARFFGYYEGAKGVSGDYFDYLDLDGRYYAIIKCDVAGKGVSAALIMIQVATMFLNYFKQWKPTAQGMLIEELVYQINDFFENLGFNDRFAAFTLCLFDSETGLLRFCNAGDNIIRFFDASGGQLRTMSLPETPATGVLPNFLIKSKGGYQVQTLTIDHGDILLLYTDGIEEAKRKFRDSEFREIICTDAPEGAPHGSHMAGEGNEELGAGQVERVVNAVMNRSVFTLRKWHNGEGNRELNFNFSNCKGSAEEVIMALVSVEKMFRCYKDPKAGEDSLVLVDKKIDAFLKSCFLQYRDYCSFVREYPGNEAYMYYTHIKEDEQYDDLTILGIERK